VSFSWDLDGDRTYDARGRTVAVRFSAIGSHLVLLRALARNGRPVTDEHGRPIVSRQKVPVLAAASPCLPTQPFNLLFGARDANGLPLNPEWAWQCDHHSPRTPRVAEYPNPYLICDGFKYNTAGPGLLTGPGCSSEISEWDVPSRSDWLYYTICHAKETFPFLPLEGDTFVHGHVNWLPVTYTGRMALKDIGDLFSDGDTNLSLYPDGSTAPQLSARTVPGLTPANVESSPARPEYEGALHLEYSTGEIEPALGGRLDSWEEKLEAASYLPGRAQGTAVAVGLLGLDNRHEAKTELHPVFAFAVREPGGASGKDSWLVMFRNSGDEGGCSSQDLRRHQLATPGNRITLSLPSPNGTAASVRFERAFLRGFKVPGEAKAPITAALSADHQHTTVTATLPSPGEGAILVGEISLTWTGRHGELITPPQPSAPLPPAARGLARAAPAEQAGGTEPDELLVSLKGLLTPLEQAELAAILHGRHVPSAPGRACEILAPAAERARHAGTDPTQVQLVKELLKCK
jgi:hypothetical protein